MNIFIGYYKWFINCFHLFIFALKVFQKGEQTMAVASPENPSLDRVQEYPTLPRLKSPSSSSTCSGSTAKADDQCDSKENESIYGKITPQNVHKAGRKQSITTRQSRKSTSEKSYHYRYSDIAPLSPSQHSNYQDDTSPYHMNNDEYNESQQFSMKTTDRNRNKSNDYCEYDSIEKLRDHLAEKSPSYSYKSGSELHNNISNSYGENSSSTFDATIYQRSKRASHDSEKIYGNPIKKKSNSEYENRYASDSRSVNSSRPSSREDFIEDEERHSKNYHSHERPHRRVISPTCDIRNEVSIFH